jgi:hypothetical protein
MYVCMFQYDIAPYVVQRLRFKGAFSQIIKILYTHHSMLNVVSLKAIKDLVLCAATTSRGSYLQF